MDEPSQVVEALAEVARTTTRTTTSSISTRSSTPTTSRRRSTRSSRSGRRAATIDDDEEELEDEEPDADDRGDGPTRIVPRRPGRVPVLVVLPGPAAQPARRRGADALPRLRVAEPAARPPRRRSRRRDRGRRHSAPDDRELWSRLAACAGAGLLLGVAFPAVRHRSARLRRARRRCSGRGTGRAHERAALYGLRLRHRVLRRRPRVVAVLRQRWRSSRWSSRRPRTSPVRVRWSRPSIDAGCARRGLVAAVWVVFEALRGGWPARWAPVGGARCVAARPPVRPAPSRPSAGSPSSRSCVVVVNGLLLDLVPGAAGRRANAGLSPDAPGRRGRAGGGRGAVHARRRPALPPTVTGHLSSPCCRATTRTASSRPRRSTSDYLTRRHLALAGDLHGKYDLIVFPESRVRT